MKKPIRIVEERPACAIKGFFPPKDGQKYGAMCGSAGMGGRSCHRIEKCEHQRPKSAEDEQ